ncbi:uncharacterized protein LOC126389342 isoform X1 [Epinephelus moara]|uniref:uncharacterized protein LOC126389342 isoform X1 n=1 Tax=Epinephelus moara TaxID=300413 RepID=UPI00214EB239|nr:uncharacterized protein LOC126389342 isoform X1 [Epinephelus moara]
MAVAVVDKIVRKCHEIERAYHQGICGERELRSLDSCNINLQRIANVLSPHTLEELRRSLDGVRTRISRAGVAAEYVGFSAHRINSGRRGRPAIHVTRDQIDFLMKQGNTVKRIAKILGCSSSFLYKRTKLLGIPVRRRFSVIDDEELERHVRRLQGLYPNSGYEMMRGLLRADGLLLPRRRVREMLAHINPAAAARRWSSTVARRVYHAPYPNSLWHIDGNMRLIRWGFAVHGAIDGHSRLITYLNCNTNNRATTVLSQFLKATCHYGLPSRVRSDYGGENLQVALFMNLVQGIERRSFITGESIHNQRIERLWRDVFLHVLQSFYSTFYSLEDSHLLDPSNDIHKLSLSMVFLPEIQKSLELFREAWNNHALRTENNRTPSQIWTEGMLSNMARDSAATNNVFGENPYSPHHLEAVLAQHGIDSLPATDDDDLPAVIVEQSRINLSQQQQESISHAIDHISDLKMKYLTCCAEISNVMAT